MSQNDTACSVPFKKERVSHSVNEREHAPGKGEMALLHRCVVQETISISSRKKKEKKKETPPTVEKKFQGEIRLPGRKIAGYKPWGGGSPN